MIKTSDIGRRLRCGRLYGTFTVVSIVDGNRINVVDEGGNQHMLDLRVDKISFQSVSKQMKMEIPSVVINIGQEVFITKDTCNYVKGDRATVTGWKDDDPTKLIFDKVLPGGWINASGVRALIDISKSRIMTIAEVMASGRNPFEIVPTILLRSYPDLENKSLTELGVIEDFNNGLRLPLSSIKVNIPKSLISTNPPREAVICVSDRQGQIDRIMHPSSPEYSAVRPLMGKPLFEVAQNFKDCKTLSDKYEILRFIIMEKGYFQLPDGMILNSQLIISKYKDEEKNEKKHERQAVMADDSLPF